MAKSTWIGSEYVGSDGVKAGETRSPGLFTDKDGKAYLRDSSYQPMTGWQELDNIWYYFDTTTGVMAKETWVDGYYPVSYTHLDVYKRQLLSLPQDWLPVLVTWLQLL